VAKIFVGLMGNFSVQQDGRLLSIPGRNDRRLLALLVLSPSRVWPRREIAGHLWPEAEFEVSGNRLRTALVGLKKALGDADIVEADTHSISLRTDQIESDFDAIRALERKLPLAVSAAEERTRLDEWIDAIGPGLLPDWNDEWLAGYQEEWRQRRISALLKSAELALQAEDLPAAVARSETLLQALPFDAFGWGVYLDAMARSGKGPEAARRFSAARKRMAAEGLGDFPGQLIKLAKAVRDGTYGPAPDLPALPSGVDQAVIRAFQRMLRLDPTAAMRFVSHDAFRLEVFRDPEPSIQLLESMLQSSPKEGPEWTALAIITMRTYSLLRDVDRVLEIGTGLLDRELTPLQRRLVLSLVSFSYYLIRDFDRAFQYVDQAVEVAENHGLPHHIYFTRADRAIYLWHIGKDEEALQVFIEAFEGTRNEPEAHLSYAPAFLCGMIGQIYLMRGENEPAEEWLRHGHAYAQVRQYREQMHQIEPALAVAKARGGDPKEAARLLITGLAYPIRNRNVRAFGAALDFAAEATLLAGRADVAAACLDWGTAIRESQRHGRSLVEQKYADWIRSLVGNKRPSPSITRMNQPRQMLQELSKALHPAD